MRRVIALLGLVLVLSASGCAGGQPAAPVTPAPTSSAATLLTVPDVVGDNAAVALDRLDKIGFTDVDLGTVDGRRAVVLPQNWTVRTQSAKPGSRLEPDAKIVLGCARIGGTRWPWQDESALGPAGGSR
ncbi:hypothetical protein [Actinoplanes sp. NPDC049599]|uniref:hypothetical protein n=1 Tax=Actinoplanes sp. NPDC049599 TaxID=3363903 RepID=UPI0037AB87B1